jgi:hypothetical protein
MVIPMAELERDTLVFRFPEVHPQAELTVTFIRTLRLPDDGKKYPLPPGLGSFPLRHVEDFKSKVPAEWSKHGGIMLPMYQSEALWISFKSSPAYDRMCNGYPFAVKISAGKRSAVTGKPWSKNLRENDYVIVPDQPWIDGFVVEDGVVKQFVAVPLGMGMTVEGQLSGKEEFGGIQIQAFPMKRKSFDKKYPVRPQVTHSPDILRGSGQSFGGGFPFGGYHIPGVYSQTIIGPQGSTGPMGAQGAQGDYLLGSDDSHSNNVLFSSNSATTKGCSSLDFGPKLTSMNARARKSAPRNINYLADCDDSNSVECCAVADMGLGAGGSMAQQVFKDPHKFTDWDQSVKNRCFVHIVNTMVWQTVTGSPPPTLPRTASDYSMYNLPWFDFYVENVKSQKGTKELKGVKTIAQMSKKKGIPVLPENKPANPKHIVLLGHVQEGKW